MRSVLVGILGVLLTASAAAQSPPPHRSTTQKVERAEFEESIERLRQNPSDRDLRARVIELGARLRPAPAIPEEARRNFVQAVTLQKSARSSQELGLVIEKYEAALGVVPWWADAYYNKATALQLAGRYRDAIAALEFYLRSGPKDARAAQDKIYALEAEEQQAAERAKAKAEEEARERQRQAALQQQHDLERRQQQTVEYQSMLHPRMAGEWEIWVSTCSRQFALVMSFGGSTAEGCSSYGKENRLVEQPAFAGDGTILIALHYPTTTGSGSTLKALVGTPAGPSITDISWKCLWSDGYEHPAFSQADPSRRVMLIGECGTSRAVYWTFRHK